MQSPQVQFLQANQALKEGELERARKLLKPLLESPQWHCDARHTLAVVERRLGNLQTAADHFSAVSRERPSDPFVLNNYANCLRDLGEFDAAIAKYQAAVRLKPDYMDAAINLAMLQKNLGRLQEAETGLRLILDNCGATPKLLHGLGTVLREQGKHDEAAIMLDLALAGSADTGLLHLRALVEAERGGESLPFYEVARSSAPENPEIQLGHGVALWEAGREVDALAGLQLLTQQHPDWPQGHVALAQLRWQLGHGVGFADSFITALHQFPRDRGLRIAFFTTLMRAGRYGEVLSQLNSARGTLEPALLDRYEASCASESGDLALAKSAFNRLPIADDEDLEIARIRFHLRARDFATAATLAERLAVDLNRMSAWPYLSLAWRMTADPRSKWLDGGDSFFGFVDCTELVGELPELAHRLQQVHHGREHPFDQSMRGGSQTDGNLFLRSDPLLTELRRIITLRINEFLQQLPAPDPRHPFLRLPRNQCRFLASYSVRLRANGFHVNHMHPEAAVSCCFYVDMPQSIGTNEADPAGWLSLGMPPVELGLALEPQGMIRPEPGRLAMFPSIMWHGTYPFPAGERLTVVSDLTLV